MNSNNRKSILISTSFFCNLLHAMIYVLILDITIKKLIINLPKPGTKRFRKKQNVANGIGKIGIAALTIDFLSINFGSIGGATILNH